GLYPPPGPGGFVRSASLLAPQPRAPERLKRLWKCDSVGAAAHCVDCAQCVFAVTFASLADTLDHLQPDCGSWWRSCATSTATFVRRRKGLTANTRSPSPRAAGPV